MSGATNKVLFSIIIPTYNHAHFINRCIDSLISQTCTEWEAIVVNNFSEDNTIELIEAYHDDRIKIVNFRNNGIIGASRNFGIKQANGEWICFLDSDDWWYPGKLQECLNISASSDVLYHDMDVYTIKGKRKLHFRYCRKLSGSPLEDLILNGNALYNSTVVVRKSILDKIGTISEESRLIAVEDYDYWIRIATVTSRFYFIPKILSGYWVGTSNISTSKDPIAPIEYLFNKNLPLIPNSLAEEARKRFAFRKAALYIMLNDKKNASSCYKTSLKSDKLSISVKSLINIFSLKVVKRAIFTS
jgi:glycosyltransferase involved in cell wall biosynthesis